MPWMRVSIELSQTYKKSKPEVFVKSDKSVRSVKSAMSFRLLFTNETDRHILLTDLYWYSLALSLNLMLWRLEFCDSCWRRYQSILASSYVVSGAENVADATLDFTSLSPPSGLRILAHDLVNTLYSWVSCAFDTTELPPLFTWGPAIKKNSQM